MWSIFVIILLWPTLGAQDCRIPLRNPNLLARMYTEKIRRSPGLQHALEKKEGQLSQAAICGKSGVHENFSRGSYGEHY